MQPFLQIDGVGRRFGDVDALRGIDAVIEQGEIVTFAGPSGAGKTTLLRLLAGIDQPSTGQIHRADSLSGRFAGILVFQDYLLFPHMTVFENVAFGLRSSRRRDRHSASDIELRVHECLAQLGIADKAHAWPAHLSGGQRQRVALARALVMEPELLLLDEPFANLDRNLKAETATFVRELHESFGLTTVMVSHDLDEASEISDRIGVIVGGELRQIDRFETVYFQPADRDVATLFGPINVIPREMELEIIGEARAPAGYLCGVRPESIMLEADPKSTCVVSELRLISGAAHYRVTCDAWTATVRVGLHNLKVGDRVRLRAQDVFPVKEEES